MNISFSAPHILAQLTHANQQLLSEMVNHENDTTQSSDEKLESNCPIFDSVYEDRG